jgi:hypothetical protein
MEQQETTETIDLFEDIESLPEDVYKTILYYSNYDETYYKAEELLEKLEKLNYTFDYDLDAIPYNLRQIKTDKINQYNYVIIKESYPELERESALDFNNYKKSKKYALICKGIHKDGSESIYFIKYSNDLQELQEQASKYISWYNYPLNLTKNIQGFISELN